MVYWLLRIVATPILRLLYRVSVEGAANVPRSGPVILAGNHLAVCDSVFLPLVLRRRVTFVAKSEYFEDRKKAWFFRAMGQIPMKREGGLASERAIDTACEVLRGGGALGIYPEGTRSPDGRLYKGHTGIARIALKTGAPVVAVGMIGTREVQTIGRPLPRVLKRVAVKFSPPLDLGRHAIKPDDPAILRKITDEIMFELTQLTGQEYVDRYAVRQAAHAGSKERAGVVRVGQAFGPIEDQAALKTAG